MPRFQVLVPFISLVWYNQHQSGMTQNDVLVPFISLVWYNKNAAHLYISIVLVPFISLVWYNFVHIKRILTVCFSSLYFFGMV